MRKNSVFTDELGAYWGIIRDFAAKIYALLKCFVHEKTQFYAGMEKGQKRWFVFCNIFLSAYSTFVFYTGRSEWLFARWDKTLAALFQSVFIFLLVYNGVVFFCSKYGAKIVNISISCTKAALKKETVLLFGGLYLVILLLALSASFPGGISPDTENQWAQVHDFSFDDWHPVIHTLLIWLVTRVIDHYAFVVSVQIAVFSLGVGYLTATLEAWGFSKKICLAAGLFIILNPYTMNIMMYPWKDLALTVLLTWTTIIVVNIYLSGGAWFSKNVNVVVFALVTALASMVRHNGFFFTASLYVIAILLYTKRNKKVLVSIGLALLCIFLVKIPLYNALNVTKPNNTYIESVGIPMTILGDVMVKKPEALPPGAKEFLNTMASDEEWREKYTPGSYNSIKWEFKAANIIKTVPPETLLQWTLQTCINAKYEAFHAFCGVTGWVWKIEKAGMVNPPVSGKNNALTKALHICFYGYTSLCLIIPVVSSLFMSTGMQMLLLLCAGIVSLSKNGAKVLLPVLPSVMYNLGTMFLLCGPDIRFFHFNAVITLPLVLVLLTKFTTENCSA